MSGSLAKACGNSNRAFINLINSRAESQHKVKIFTDGSRIVCEQHDDKVDSVIWVPDLELGVT